MYCQSAQETARIAGATLVAGDPDAEVSSFCIDSRQAEPGATFVCFPGETHDGNDYAMAAVEAGCACVVATREPGQDLVQACAASGCALLRAAGDDAEGFLESVAAWYRERQDWVVLGVTGSVGKTTTKDLLACALATSYRVHKNVGNFNSVIGVPLTVLSAPDDTQVFVCEMGMNHPGEIDRICRVARPQLACVTNIGTSHIGFLGSQENIARAKGECVRWLADPLPAFRPVSPLLALVDGDGFTPFLASEFADRLGVATALVGFRPDDAVTAEDVSLDGEGHVSVTVRAGEEQASASLRLTGRQVVPDLLLCCALTGALGVPLAQALQAAAGLEPTSMRTDVHTSPHGFRVIDDSYNASPASLAAALDLLCEMECDGRRIAVLGEVGELGDQAARLHGLMGAYVAAKPLDLVAFVGGPNASVMEDAAQVMGLSEDVCVRLGSAEDAVRVLGPVLGPGDLVLAKGSRSVGLDRFVKEVLA